jgi:hypothetical protein
MADDQQDSKGQAVNSENNPVAALSSEVQGVASVWDFGWRAGLQVTQAIGGIVANRRDRKSLGQAQRSNLGQWVDLACPDGRLTKRPVLKADKFRDYMVETDGRFKPGGPCLAQAEWAHFVHALGIDPARNILAWRSPRRTSSNSESLTSCLEIDGEVLCHIINLFGEKSLRRGVLNSISQSEKQGSLATSFAQISWDTATRPISTSFQLADDESIWADRMPFGSVGEIMDQGTVITKHYFNAIYEYNGCSDSEYGWPDPTRPIKERLCDLILNITKVEGLPMTDMVAGYEFSERFNRVGNDLATGISQSFEQFAVANQLPEFSGVPGAERLVTRYAEYAKRWRNRKQPVLLTQRWLDEANRIWRRATSGDGSDSRFLDDIYHAIEGNSLIEGHVKETIRIETSSGIKFETKVTSRADLTKQIVRKGFLFEGDSGYQIFLRRGQLRRISSKSWSPEDAWAREAVDEVLESYQEAKQNTDDAWKRDLYAARHEIRWLIFSSGRIVCDADHVRYLYFRPDSALWETTCQLVCK